MISENNQEITIDELVQKIASLQSRGDKYFPEGIFPSYRQNKYIFYKRPDTNIFYTATIVFVLNQLKPNLSPKSQQIVEQITTKAIRNYADFQNKDGLKTYNFWQTPINHKPSNHFPNGLIFKYLEHFRLPDDIDDTSLVYLTSSTTKEQIIWLKEKLMQHANLSEGSNQQRQVRNTFSHYKTLKVYSTWFGKNMAIEFDACALCNLMYLIEKYQLPCNQYDIDTYQFLKGIIERDELLTHPFQVSHNYATAPLIIYHFARLLGEFKIEALEGSREKLIRTALQLLGEEKIKMNKILLQTALIKLNGGKNNRYSEEVVQWSISKDFPSQNSDFCYFLGPLLSAYENPILHFFAPMKISQMEWKCEAHEWVLLLENIIEKSK